MQSMFLKEIFEGLCVWSQLLWQAVLWLCSFGCRGVETVSTMRIAKLNGEGTGGEM